MTPEQTALVDRIRALITDELIVRGVSMFGGRSVMVNEKILVSALKGGGLLVRVDARQHDALLRKPGATQATMGPGRDMGPGWLEVAADTISDEEQLSSWIDTALDYNRAVAGGRS